MSLAYLQATTPIASKALTLAGFAILYGVAKEKFMLCNSCIEAVAYVSFNM